MDTRFLVTKKNTGLGSDLATLVGAWYYARRTCRSLVIDWRDSLYLADRKLNAFPRLFHPLSELEGVRILCGDSLDKRKFPKPVAFLHRLDRRHYAELLAACVEIPAPTLLNRRPMHVLPPAAVQRRILSLLKPCDQVQREIEEFRDREFAGATVLGVHVRHGNGEHLCHGRDTSIQDACFRIANLCHSVFRKLAGTRRRCFRVFLATDSNEIEQNLRLLLNTVFTRPKRFQESGGGRLHRRQFGLDSAQDALIEMRLLAHCNALIYSPSWFSYYARVTGDFDLAPVNLLPSSTYAAV